MSDEIKKDELPSEEEAPELNEDGVPRPAADPKNKLYTFLSLLIFAVIYIGWQLIKGNIYFSYALYADDFSPEEQAAVIAELPQFDPQLQAELKYARLHKNFDGNCFYAAFSLPADISEDEELIDRLISFPCGDPGYDIRMTVYPDPDVIPDYVYGDCYVSTEDPKISCMIYSEGDSCTAVFRIADYSGDIGRRVGDWEKIPVK
ncbi:MAG: hypothetical protein ACI4J0_03525 [Huintestinicola sp.]|uniref:hypothetical protein n=1 Tax=Huintestinicola sp. TaxID=2981661 RepID=UPI003EFFE7FB